jgi:hypothetical protein
MVNDVMMIVSVLVSFSALALSVFNLRHLEPLLKRSAAIIAEMLRLAEPMSPFLRSSKIDNYIREVLRAYAASDPFFVHSLNATSQTAERVADILPLLDPELKIIGKAMSLPVDKSRALMTNVVHRVKDYHQMVQQIQGDLQRLT